MIPVTISFSEPVFVTGSPLLALNTTRNAGYVSGGGTPTLTFNYVVLAGDTAADLDYTATTQRPAGTSTPSPRPAACTTP